ncbi:hypothetical protein CWI84_10255 [Idiomarina tyrosinivorans]|uniref:Outer membrane protein beta-barrel domain-containing protein n=1 Tax=Idiomarina tyrosinivorans TaxID=1445662 RepID=A0A432ZLQ7_9GAMM|nr:outer membrane beta-barrel protein [Idiomarina tyrosinivorans]RUO78921.1 hypothetical protein CWI84_10255 [Idiomarina tyrosinivorans]
MKKTFVIASIFGLTALSANSAFAQQAPQSAGSSKTYAEFAIEDFDDIPADNGIRLQGSYDIGNDIFVSGYYRRADADNGSDPDSFAVSAGKYFSLGRGLADGLSLDLGATAGRVDFGAADSSFYGVQANISQRIDMFEFHAGTRWIDYTDGDDDLQANIGARMMLNSQWSVGLDFAETELGDLWGINARYSF